MNFSDPFNTILAEDGAQIELLSQAHIEDFSLPNLENFRPPRFPTLSIANELITRLRKRRLLLLAGPPLIDKNSLARYLADCLARVMIREQQGNAQQRVEIQEWSGKGGQKIDRVLLNFSQPTIFILPMLHPQHFDYNLAALTASLGLRHYAVATIEYEEPWQWVDMYNIGQYWQSLQTSKVYTSEDLASFLIAYSAEEGIDHQKHFDVGSGTRFRIGGVHVEDIVTQLETPQRVQHFTCLLRDNQTDTKYTKIQVERYIKTARQSSTSLWRLYRLIEEPRLQLIILTIYLLDGLVEGQFFDVVDLLVDKAWRQRDPTLRRVEYYELQPLEHFYDFALGADGKRTIKTKTPEQRREVLEILWNTHKRHIIDALPLFYQLIKESMIPKAHSRLYASQERCERLRKTLTETISDIGLKDPEEVEQLLLTLGSDPAVGVQAVAARIITRWYERGNSNIALALLQRWVEGRIERGRIGAIESNGSYDRRDRFTALRATAVLAIGYAAETETTQRLPRDFVRMLDQVAQGDDEQAISYLVRYTLPMLLPSHLKKLRGVMVRLLGSSRWQSNCLTLLSGQIRSQADLLLKIGDDWLQRFILNEALRSGPAAQVSISLGEGVCELFSNLTARHENVLPVDGLIARMLLIFRCGSVSAPVRNKALNVVISHAQTHYCRFKSFLLIANGKERSALIQALARIHYEQHLSIKGRRSYSTTEESTAYALAVRTDVENELLTWIKDYQQPALQQIGLCAYFEALEYEGKTGQDVIRGFAHQGLPGNSGLPYHQLSVGLYFKHWYLYNAVPMLVGSRSESEKMMLRHLLPELTRHWRRDRELVNRLLARLSSCTDDAIVRTARQLGDAQFWIWLGSFVLSDLSNSP